MRSWRLHVASWDVQVTRVWRAVLCAAVCVCWQQQKGFMKHLVDDVSKDNMLEHVVKAQTHTIKMMKKLLQEHGIKMVRSSRLSPAHTQPHAQHT